MPHYEVAVIGGGFAGMMVLHHLTALAPAGARFAILEPRATLGEGPAYQTRHPNHLLNVPAKSISAFADQPDHFLDWLNGPAGKAAAENLHLALKQFLPGDFAPRALFASYLSEIHAATLAEARRKSIIIDHLPIIAQRVTANKSDGFLVATAHRTLAAKKIVLALGNLPPEPSANQKVIGDVWHFDYATLRGSTEPLAIIGAGLTMVDVFLSLTYAGHEGPVHAISRHALLPQTHASVTGDYKSLAHQWAEKPQALARLMHFFRAEIVECRDAGLNWQLVFDKWRPFLPRLWMNMGVPDRVRFLQRLFTYWNIHRHRMAPESAAVVDHEIERGRLHLHAGHVPPLNSGTQLIVGGKPLEAALIFDCRGPSYDLARSDNALLQQMGSDGLITRHATGWGIEIDRNFCVQGTAPYLFALGTLAIGARLETTAVPELREQAKEVAAEVLKA